MDKIYFNENYQKNEFKIDFLNTKNFIIFKIENFLDEQNYNFFNSNFPKIDEVRLKNFSLKENNYKYLLSSKDDSYEEMLLNNINLKKIHDTIFSEKFFSFFYNNLKKYFFLSRIYDLKFFLKLFKPKVLNESKKKLNFQTHIKRQIEYSYIFNNGKIVPHTDSRNKLLSLMLFFPEFDSKNNNKLHVKEKKTGTIFWDSKDTNIDNLHLVNPKEEEEFILKNKILLNIPFDKYHLYGFIRNKVSWHSVDTLNVQSDYIRKSININFYF